MLNKKLLGIAGAVCILVIPWLIGYSSPHLESDQSLCPLKLLTGLPCPGCGITKSIYFFYQGNLDKSLAFHILGPLVVVFSILALATLVLELITHKSYFNRWMYNSRFAWTLAVGLSVYHTIRLASFLLNHSFQEIIKESVWQ